ncbi:ISAs1 family transposase [Streptomyces sp. NBC_00876]|uniref:ISAs1 family transposase n=1 Tax=Streptomyces sp. NBC_00876 TaxID=2975853 RepID=UPI00386FE383|nr:ISAs1 family transposase [Streptomyces sp. NBC_00876]
MRAVGLSRWTARRCAAHARPRRPRWSCSSRWSTGTVLAQRQIADKSNEIPAFAPPLDAIENLDGVAITADALHTQHAHGAYLRSRGAHYLAIVKKNHAKLHDRVRHPPWRDMPLEHYDRTRAHHRIEIRRLKAAAFDHLDHPDAKQALQIARWRLDRATGELTIERIHLITSLAPGAATGPELASWIRGHWGIENPLHHVRDRTFREDDSKLRTGHLPRTMASLRNLAIGIHRQDGAARLGGPVYPGNSLLAGSCAVRPPELYSSRSARGPTRTPTGRWFRAYPPGPDPAVSALYAGGDRHGRRRPRECGIVTSGHRHPVPSTPPLRAANNKKNFFL